MSPSKRKVSSSTQPPKKRLKESHITDGEFQILNASLVLSIPPVFAANPRAGADEMLDSMVMRYIPSLKGVVLSHTNLKFVDKVAAVQADCPFLVCAVTFDATVWYPRVGLSLSGKVSLCSPDHISLLVHRTFNVSIPRHHIPTDIWEFEYGPAENDPEYGNSAQEGQDVVTNKNVHEIEHTTGGKWVHRVTGKVLGSETGTLEFTVIGLTVANEMLSLLGSLQPDPFSPLHTIPHDRIEVQKDEQEGQEGSEKEDEGATSDSEGVDDDESEPDTFQLLGKRKARDDSSQNVGRVKDKKR